MKTIFFSVIPNATAIKTSVATSTGAVDYTGVALNGSTGGTAMSVPRTLTVTTSAHTASYNVGSKYVVIGLDANGTRQTENFVITAANGGETLAGSKVWTQVTEITGEAQVDALGAITVGVRDIVPGYPSALDRVRVGTGTNGNLKVGYNDGSTDTFGNLNAGEYLDAAPSIIYGDSNTTITSLRLFFRGR